MQSYDYPTLFRKVWDYKRKIMAIYEYACIECDKTTEVNRGMNEPESIPPCPLCGYSMTRVYNSFGISLKGSGFYSTDNRKP